MDKAKAKWNTAQRRIAAVLWFAMVPVLAVGYVTGSASWQHIVHVGTMVQEPSAAMLPVAVDGMMLTGALLAWVDRMRGYEPRGWSIVALWLGSMMTVTFNVLSAWQRGIAAMVVAAIFAITFLVTVEAVFHPSRIVLGQTVRALRRAARHAARMAQVMAQVPATVPEPAPEVPVSVPVTPVAAPEPALIDPLPIVPTVPAPEPAPEPVVATLVESEADAVVSTALVPVIAPAFSDGGRERANGHARHDGAMVAS